MDDLLGRDRTAFMKAGHQSQFTRYLCGLDDGQAILCLQNSKSLWDEAYGGAGQALSRQRLG